MFRFDIFMINQMGCMNEHPSVQERKNAYQEFLRRIDECRLATAPTMKRWFGIGGVAVPSRENVFAICFALQLNAKETEKYLTVGLGEPSFQINDYQETIYWYGLEHGYRMEQCEKLIYEYEIKMAIHKELSTTRSTNELMQQFTMHKFDEEAMFMQWMVSNSSYFKGYSNTLLNYLKRYRQLVYESAKEEARICLQSLLIESDYKIGKKNKFESQSIREYIYHKKGLDSDLRDNILELVRIVFGESESNLFMIKELFSFDYKKALSSQEYKRVHPMTEKRMADLMGSALQKERMLRANVARSQLHEFDDEMKCPEEIQRLAEQIGYQNSLVTVREAKQWFDKFIKSQKGRCLLIQRSDLLPFLIYMFEKQYWEQIDYDEKRYNKEKAKNMFVDLVNQTMTACNMAMFDEKYEMDYLCSLCFQDDGMYSLYDVIDENYCLQDSPEIP